MLRLSLLALQLSWVCPLVGACGSVSGVPVPSHLEFERDASIDTGIELADAGRTFRFCDRGSDAGTACVLLQSRTSLYELDLISMTPRYVGDFEPGFLTDIALHPDGTLYGLFQTEIVRFDGKKLATTLIGTTERPSDGVLGLGRGMEFGPNGSLYIAMDSDLAEFDPRTGHVRMLATFPSHGGFPTYASGDLIVVRGAVYATASTQIVTPLDGPDLLVEFDLTSSVGREVGSTGIWGVWGLFTDGENVLGADASGAIGILDLTNGAFTPIEENWHEACFGATTAW